MIVICFDKGLLGKNTSIIDNYMLRNKKGSTILTTPIIIAIGIMMVTSLIVLAVQILIPYLWYEKLSSTCIKYVYVMEEFGYLTSQEARTLKEDLRSQGFDIDKLNMNAMITKIIATAIVMVFNFITRKKFLE